MTYGIGLITADEVVLAGGWNSNNYNYYLYTGQYYWTMSPSYAVDGFGANERRVNSNGSADDNYFVNISGGARPVFNLKSEVLLQGTGKASDPYHLDS